MHRTGEFVFQHPVDVPLTGNTILADKIGRDHQQFEMAVAMARRTGMAGMFVRFIFKLKIRYIESCAYFLLYGFRYCHFHYPCQLPPLINLFTVVFKGL